VTRRVEEGKEVGKERRVGKEEKGGDRPLMIGSMSYTLDRPFVGCCGGTVTDECSVYVWSFVCAISFSARKREEGPPPHPPLPSLKWGGGEGMGGRLKRGKGKWVLFLPFLFFPFSCCKGNRTYQGSHIH